MSKHKNKNKNRNKNHSVWSQNGQGKPETPAEQASASALSQATEVHSAAVQAAEAAGVAISEPAGSVAEADGASATSAIDIARKAASIYAALEEDVKGRLQALEQREKSFDEASRTQKDESARLETLAAGLKSKEQDLITREQELFKEREDAKHGFIRLQRQTFDSTKARLDEREAELEEERRGLVEQRRNLAAVLHERQTALEQEFEKRAAEREAQFDGRLADLRKREIELRRREHAVTAGNEILEEDKAQLERRVNALVARREAEFEADRAALESSNAALREELQRAKSDLLKREVFERRLPGTPEEILVRLDNLEREKSSLQEQLAARPDIQAIERIAILEGQVSALEAELATARQQNQELRRQNVRKDIAVVELEALRNERESLKGANAVLLKANETLRSQNDQLLEKDVAKHPFPSCSRLDEDPDYQRQPELDDRPLDLKRFVQSVRERMAAPPGGAPLYYTLRDVRLLVAGLAMSRLHLLQGVSGTGKTSLPIAFAQAIGAGWGLIEVQAGWRERQDLLGYFNSFEKKFYEHRFLAELYKAQTPAYSDRPYMLVLDEMNLSHPEQYAADILSQLEKPAGDRQLQLASFVPSPLPKRFIESSEGCSVRIPDNVWFVGTANHDETTRDFAPKTYDRAHVMELPLHPERFSAKPASSQRPCSWSVLKSAFDRAASAHPTEGQLAFDYLRDNLAELLRERFDVGWGSRLLRQLNAFLPVYMDCGGTLADGTDHVLSTKILLKLKNRHDTSPDDIKQLRNALAASWPSVLGDQPRQSLALLDGELRRFRATEEMGS